MRDEPVSISISRQLLISISLDLSSAMLVLTPMQSQPYIYSQDALLEADYYEFMTHQAAQDYTIARARLEAIERQRERDLYHRHGPLNRCYTRPGFISRQRYHQHIPAAPSPSIYLDSDPALIPWHEEERRQNLFRRQREVQRQQELAQAAEQQEAERSARAQLARQQLQEQERQEAERRARAREIRQEQGQKAFIALLGLVVEAAAAVQRQEVCTTSSCTCTRPILTSPLSQSGPSVGAVAAPTASSERVAAAISADRKGKGRAVEVPPVATRASAPAQPAHKVPTFKEELETCIRSETDPQVQESLVLLYSDLFDSPLTSDSQPVAGPSKPPGTRVRVSVEGSAPATFTSPTEVKLARRPTFESRPASEGPPSRRTLEEIKEVGIALRELEKAFEFPEHLDFVPLSHSDAAGTNSFVDEPGKLAYTPNNAPIHAYEHALNALLTRLDAVESNGDLEVRRRRKEVVKAVERALEVVERRVEESREIERERSRDQHDGSTSSVEIKTARAFLAEEITVQVPSAVEHTHAPYSIDVVEKAVVAPLVALDVPGFMGATVEGDSAVTADVPIDPLLEEGPSSPADMDTSEAILIMENEPQPEERPDVPDAAPQFKLAASPEETTLEVSAHTTEDATGYVTMVPLEPSSSEYILPPVSVSMQDNTAPFDKDAPKVMSPPFVVDITEYPIAGAGGYSDVLPLSVSDSAALAVAQDTPPSSSVHASEPMSRPASATSSTAGEASYSLSTPLADEPMGQESDICRVSDEVEIITKEEVEAARHDSDWSDLETDT